MTVRPGDWQPHLLLAWHLLLQSLLILHSPPVVAGAKERIVHWNSSNPLFKPAGENLLTVQLQDRINFVCPTDGIEFYLIYWTTTWAQSQSCSGGSLLFSCRRMDSYLVYVQIFPADPTAPGFNSPVYFYTPSSGDLLGMDQTQGGACLTRNMRLTIRVVDSAAADSPSPDAQTAAATTRQPSTSGGGGSQRPQQTAAVQSSTTNKDALSSSPLDENHRGDPYQLNLITGSSVPAPDPPTVAALSSCALLLSISLPRLL